MNDQMIQIQKVTEFTPALAEEIRHLAKQEGDNYQDLTDDDLKEMISYPTHTLLIARDIESGRAAGMILVMTYRIPYVRKAYLDDLVVDTDFRQRGIATQLFHTALDVAKESGAAYVDFTSKPARVAGNNLYEKLGFVSHDTNIYRYIFHYGKDK